MKIDGLLPEGTTLRSSKYLNNLIEQDHRNLKARVNVMLSFNRFRTAATTIAGIELMHRIRKGERGTESFEKHEGCFVDRTPCSTGLHSAVLPTLANLQSEP
jgi:transposase-like protein